MINIIVVDDDITNVSLLQMLLELDGYHVDACTNIEQAIAAATADTRIFLVDWHLERNISGLDLLQAVRNGQTNAPADTAIIITSGDHRRKEEALRNGANNFLLKPYSTNKLSEAITNILNTEDGRG
ncbi:MAG: response regulator [Chloroflexi bacterium]|nr:response regulator [Chloroflexota bacterium]